MTAAMLAHNNLETSQAFSELTFSVNHVEWTFYMEYLF